MVTSVLMSETGALQSRMLSVVNVAVLSEAEPTQLRGSCWENNDGFRMGPVAAAVVPGCTEALTSSPSIVVVSFRAALFGEARCPYILVEMNMVQVVLRPPCVPCSGLARTFNCYYVSRTPRSAWLLHLQKALWSC